jgi:hypothetical protein
MFPRPLSHESQYVGLTINVGCRPRPSLRPAQAAFFDSRSTAVRAALRTQDFALSARAGTSPTTRTGLVAREAKSEFLRVSVLPNGKSYLWAEATSPALGALPKSLSWLWISRRGESRIGRIRPTLTRRLTPVLRPPQGRWRGAI